MIPSGWGAPTSKSVTCVTLPCVTGVAVRGWRGGYPQVEWESSPSSGGFWAGSCHGSLFWLWEGEDIEAVSVCTQHMEVSWAQCLMCSDGTHSTDVVAIWGCLPNEDKAPGWVVWQSQNEQGGHSSPYGSSQLVWFWVTADEGIALQLVSRTAHLCQLLAKSINRMLKEKYFQASHVFMHQRDWAMRSSGDSRDCGGSGLMNFLSNQRWGLAGCSLVMWIPSLW